MDFTYLLTVIGTFISIYEISEDYKKRNFVFKFGSYDLILVALIFLLFIYFTLVESYIEIKLEENEMYIVPQICGFSCSYLIVISVLLLIIAVSLFVVYKLNSNEIIRKKEFIDNLQAKSSEKKYDVIISDLWIFYDSFNNKSNKSLILSIIFCKVLGLKGSLKRKLDILKAKSQTAYEKMVLNIQQIWNAAIKNEKNNDTNKLLSDFLNTILRNKEFISEMLNKNPLLALKLLDSEFINDKTYVWSLYGEYLVQNKNSLFYRELNENFAGEKHLLNFLFSDVKKCSDLLAWAPIGEEVIEYIRNQRRKDLDYEKLITDTYEQKKWESPIYNGIVFFDQMVNKALEQNFEWHMWLFYLNHFVKEIVENIEYCDEENEEFKSMYEYYLYSIFSTYESWIKYIERNNYSIELDNNSEFHQNENIIKSSVISMTQSLSKISKSTNIRQKFKLDLACSYLKLYFDFAISQEKKQNDYSIVMKNCLKDRLSYDEGKNDLWDLLSNALDSLDPIPIRLKKNGPQKMEEFELFLENFNPDKDQKEQ